MHQVHRLCADDGTEVGLLYPCLELHTPGTVPYTAHCILYHAWPPESLFDQADCAVPALVSGETMATIYGGSSLVSGYHEHQHLFLTAARGGL